MNCERESENKIRQTVNALKDYRRRYSTELGPRRGFLVDNGYRIFDALWKRLDREEVHRFRHIARQESPT